MNLNLLIRTEYVELGWVLVGIYKIWNGSLVSLLDHTAAEEPARRVMELVSCDQAYLLSARAFYSTLSKLLADETLNHTIYRA